MTERYNPQYHKVISAKVHIKHNKDVQIGDIVLYSSMLMKVIAKDGKTNIASNTLVPFGTDESDYDALKEETRYSFYNIVESLFDCEFTDL